MLYFVKNVTLKVLNLTKSDFHTFVSPHSAHFSLKTETFIIFGVIEFAKYKAALQWSLLEDDIDLQKLQTDFSTNEQRPSYTPEEELEELNWTLNLEQAFPAQSQMCYTKMKNVNDRYGRA